MAEPAPVAEAPSVAGTSPAVAAVADAPVAEAPVADDPDDPLKLIRPASGTSKREHG
jgi:hypothetical protein